MRRGRVGRPQRSSGLAHPTREQTCTEEGELDGERGGEIERNCQELGEDWMTRKRGVSEGVRARRGMTYHEMSHARTRQGWNERAWVSTSASETMQRAGRATKSNRRTKASPGGPRRLRCERENSHKERARARRVGTRTDGRERVYARARAHNGRQTATKKGISE